MILGGKPDVCLLDSIEVKDISLTDYIQTRHAVYVPHTAGRYAKKQFKKAQMPIVERLVDRFVPVPSPYCMKSLTLTWPLDSRFA